MGRKRVKSKTSITRLAQMVEKIDDLGKDIDEMKKMSNSEIQLLWKNVFDSKIKPITIDGYRRLWNQITKQHDSKIRENEYLIDKIEEELIIERDKDGKIE